jgi:hypothetical protein
MSNDDSDAAEDYRRQRQAAAAKITGYKPMSLGELLSWADDDKETILKMARGAGPAKDDDEKVFEAYKQSLLSTAPGSPFDDVTARAIVEPIIGEIEGVCDQHGFATHAGVVYGTDPMSGLNIGQRAVMATDASIIEVSSHFLSFANTLAKLMSRTIPYRQIDGDTVHILRTTEGVRDVLMRDVDLVHDWSEALASFAATGVQPVGAQALLIDAQNAIRTLLLRAIEVFAIGHEYGHHSLRHGVVSSSTGSTEQALLEEFHADLFARGCSMAIGQREDEENFYAVSGAGGVLILGSLELIRRTNALLETGRDEPPPIRHHPPFLDRVANLAALDDKLHEDNRGSAVELRQFIVEALEVVWEFVKPIVMAYHRSGIRPKHNALESSGWLPS